jgi:molybdate transport system regulatory protein
MGPSGGAGSIQAHSETQSPASWLCRGTVSRITRGGVNADVVINLPGGATISAIITLDSLEHLGLQEGGRACAVFKAGSVILGINA